MSNSIAINRRTFLGSMAGVPAGLWISLASPDEVTAATTQQLAEGFAKPPDAARPWVYWFWINGNVTKAGITADLEAMQRVGIGGVLIMEVDGQPIGTVAFASEQWRDMFKFACEEASRLGLEINMNDAAGWTGSAGPWITPEMSMQSRVVWSRRLRRKADAVSRTLCRCHRRNGHPEKIGIWGLRLELTATAISQSLRSPRRRMPRTESPT